MNKYYYSQRKSRKERSVEKSEEPQPWDQLSNESDQAYEAFCVYRNLGFSRSLEKTAMRVYNTDWEANIRFVEEWAKKFDWEKRSHLWDAHWDQYHDRIKRKAQQDAEARYIDSLPDIQEEQINIALGKKQGDRTQGVMINRIVDQVVPKPQQKPQDVNIWNNVALVAPELPKEVKSGLLSDEEEIDPEKLNTEAQKLIPDKLRNKK